MGQSLSSLDSQIQEQFAELAACSGKADISATVTQLWEKFKDKKLDAIDMAPLLQTTPTMTLGDNPHIEDCRALSLRITKLVIKYNQLDRQARFGAASKIM